MNARETEFDWDEANVRHVARHSVLPDEAEHVILNDPVDLGVEIVVVTAFEPIKRIIQFYYQERER